ncbi:MAG: GNAT family N-acetyltransferase [Candidatus Xenobiia bacterium LiM19]
MNIEIRKADKEDFSFISELALESYSFGIPSQRLTGTVIHESLLREALDELFTYYGDDSDIDILVAFDRENGERAGYIMVLMDHQDQNTGERQAFIHDLAVKRKYWGKYVVHRLIDAASESARKRGLRWLVGVVTRNNRRALHTAVKALGFEIERHQVMKKLKGDDY